MDRNEHTPGPWALEPQPFRFFYQVFRDCKLVASIPTGGNKNSEAQLEEKKANARLIAAAPDLLEALEYCLDCLGSEFALPADCIDQAKDAIAKARGES